MGVAYSAASAEAEAARMAVFWALEDQWSKTNQSAHELAACAFSMDFKGLLSDEELPELVAKAISEESLLVLFWIKKLYTLTAGVGDTFCVPYEPPFSSLAYYRDDGLILAAGTSSGQVVFYDVRGKPQPLTVLYAFGNSEVNLLPSIPKSIFGEMIIEMLPEDPAFTVFIPSERAFESNLRSEHVDLWKGKFVVYIMDAEFGESVQTDDNEED
ncbi:hypothetical protein C3L33_13251, partial [Rhododendron williamsianum]